MQEPNDKSLQMRVSAGWLRRLDDWRRGQSDLPPRAEAIRRLVEMGLEAAKQPGEGGEVTSSEGSVDVHVRDGDQSRLAGKIIPFGTQPFGLPPDGNLLGIPVRLAYQYGRVISVCVEQQEDAETLIAAFGAS